MQQSNKKPFKKKLLLKREVYSQLLQTVSKYFPKVFNIKEPKCLLKVNIHKDLKTAKVIPNSKINLFLKIYTRNQKYKELLKYNSPRYDLKGNIHQKVTFQDLEHIKTKERQINEKRKAYKLANAKNRNSKPQNKPQFKGGTLGLSIPRPRAS